MTDAKVAIIGSGAIGATIAYTLVLRREGTQALLFNRGEGRAWAKAFDLSHCLPELPGRAARAVSIGETAGSDVIVLTAGALPSEDGSRADVLEDNVGIYAALVPELARLSPGAVLVAIANPVDAMAYAALRLSGFPPERVLGSGTELDSLRLRSFAAEALGLDASRLSLEVAGEHGDSMAPLWSRCLYEGRPLSELGIEPEAELKAKLLERTRRAGWDIRKAGEHSCYAIAFSAARIVESLLDSPERPIAVSAMMDGEYEIEGAFLSLPTLLGRAGALLRLEPELAAEEVAALRVCAAAVRAQMDEVDALLSRRGI
jgi:L-lactate dehydrogenase